MSRHTQTEILMLTKLNLAHGVAHNTVYRDKKVMKAIFQLLFQTETKNAN